MTIEKKVFCIMKNGSLHIFDIDESKRAITNTFVGEFDEFTDNLQQIWGPVQCNDCLVTQLIDLGEAYGDGEPVEREMGYERNRWYEGAVPCQGCGSDIEASLMFNHYALNGMFIAEKTRGCNFVHLEGLEKFAESLGNRVLVTQEA